MRRELLRRLLEYNNGSIAGVLRMTPEQVNNMANSPAVRGFEYPSVFKNGVFPHGQPFHQKQSSGRERLQRMVPDIHCMFAPCPCRAQDHVLALGQGVCVAAYWRSRSSHTRRQCC